MRAYRAREGVDLGGGEGGSSKRPPSPPPIAAASVKDKGKKSAKRLKPRDLIERGPVLDFAGGGGGGGGGRAKISKLLHQSWMVDELPSLYAHFAGEWREALGEKWEWGE